LEYSRQSQTSGNFTPGDFDKLQSADKKARGIFKESTEQVITEIDLSATEETADSRETVSSFRAAETVQSADSNSDDVNMLRFCMNSEDQVLFDACL